MLGATLLLPEFAPYLASKEEEAEEEAAEPESHMRTEEEILEDMRRLDGL